MAGKTALLTGANSGLGFEASRQLAARGDEWGRVILACRSVERGEAAKAKLVELTGRPDSTFSVLQVDVGDMDSTHGACDALAAEGVQIDAMVLNAGGMVTLDERTGHLSSTPSGVGVGFATHLLGHAVLAARSINEGLLEPGGSTIILTGSEAARGIPAMRTHPTDLRTLAREHYDGSVPDMLDALARGQHVRFGTFNFMNEYANIKLIGALWVTAIARALGAETNVKILTVSPGNTSGTSIFEGMSGPMRFVLKYIAPVSMRMFGLSHDLETGAARYLEAIIDTNGRFSSGGFYASPNMKLTGPLTRQDGAVLEALDDQELQQESVELLSRLTDGRTDVRPGASTAPAI